MLAIWKAAAEQFSQKQDFILATILSVQGSSPRHIGTRFLIQRDGAIVGTIGGGLFEAEVRDFAAQALASRLSHRAVFSFTGKDAQSREMICGGQAEVLIEFVNASEEASGILFSRLREIAAQRKKAFLLTRIDIPVGGQSQRPVPHVLVEEDGARIGDFPGDRSALEAIPEARLLKPSQLLDIPGVESPILLEWLRPRGTVFIFGAGHVGVCVAHLSQYVDFDVVVLDDRGEFANPDRVPDADDLVVLDSFADALDRISVDEDSFLVIVTRGHAHDKTVLTQSLRTNAGYIGMIGSRRKIKVLFQALLAEGFTSEDLQRVHAPIGLPIGGETPQEIAVSIIAQMIEVRNRKDRIQGLGTSRYESCCPA
jgi:xanthine dehydrogenase accessory factor